MCFAKHTLSKHNLGRLGLKPRPDPLFFFSFWAGSSPAMQAGLDPAKPTRLLVQTSNPAGIFFFASVRKLLAHTCYRKRVIKSEKEGTKWLVDGLLLPTSWAKIDAGACCWENWYYFFCFGFPPLCSFFLSPLCCVFFLCFSSSFSLPFSLFSVFCFLDFS